MKYNNNNNNNNNYYNNDDSNDDYILFDFFDLSGFVIIISRSAVSVTSTVEGLLNQFFTNERKIDELIDVTTIILFLLRSSKYWLYFFIHS